MVVRLFPHARILARVGCWHFAEKTRADCMSTPNKVTSADGAEPLHCAFLAQSRAAAEFISEVIRQHGFLVFRG